MEGQDFPESVKLEAKQLSNFRCVVCDAPFVEVHHIKPKNEGGLGVLDNAAPLCGYHHSLVGANQELRKQLRQMRDWQWERNRRREESWGLEQPEFGKRLDDLMEEVQAGRQDIGVVRVAVSELFHKVGDDVASAGTIEDIATVIRSSTST